MLVKVLRHIVDLGAARALVADDQIAIVFSVVRGDLGQCESFAHFSVLCRVDALAACATTIPAAYAPTGCTRAPDLRLLAVSAQMVSQLLQRPLLLVRSLKQYRISVQRYTNGSTMPLVTELTR